MVARSETLLLEALSSRRRLPWESSRNTPAESEWIHACSFDRSPMAFDVKWKVSTNITQIIYERGEESNLLYFIRFRLLFIGETAVHALSVLGDNASRPA